MNLERLLDGARSAAEEAGEILLASLGRIEAVDYKGEVDLVTQADLASERLLVDRLSRLLPEASVLAEEGSGTDRGGSLRWIVDPLDGTTNFAHTYPIFCVSIALEREGERVLGVVYDPSRREMFHALRGRGTWLGRTSLRVSDTASLEKALLVTGFPYDVRTARRDNLTQFAAFLKKARAVRRDGSAALNLSYVAASRFDGFWEEGLAPWDMAAGTILVEEAGGQVTGYDGGPFDLLAGNVVASNRQCHEALVRVLSEIESSGDLPSLGERRRG